MLTIAKIFIISSFMLLISCSTTRVVDSSADQFYFKNSSRSISVALLGGGALNVTDRGVARPVQICVYLVKDKKWLPPLSKQESSCLEKSSDSGFIQGSRILLAPNDRKSIDFEINSRDDYWVVLDADFSKPESDYSAYAFKIGERDVSFYIHVNASEIM